MISTNGIMRIISVKTNIGEREMIIRGNAEFRNGLSSDMSVIGFKLTCGPKDSFYPKLMKEGMQIYASGRLKVVPGKGVFYLELDNATYNMLRPTEERRQQPVKTDDRESNYKKQQLDTEEAVVIGNGYSTQPTYLSKIQETSVGSVAEEEEDDGYTNEEFGNHGGFIPSQAASSSRGLGVLKNV